MFASQRRFALSTSLFRKKNTMQINARLQNSLIRTTYNRKKIEKEKRKKKNQLKKNKQTEFSSKLDKFQPSTKHHGQSKNGVEHFFFGRQTKLS